MKTTTKTPSKAMVVECCKCHKVRTDDGWKHMAKDTSKLVSHTYCDTCFDDACSELERLVSRN